MKPRTAKEIREKIRMLDEAVRLWRRDNELEYGTKMALIEGTVSVIADLKKDLKEVSP